MYVCVCNAVTEDAILEAVKGGVRSLEGLQMHTGCATGCGCCALMAEEVLRRAVAQDASRPKVNKPISNNLTLAVSR